MMKKVLARALVLNLMVSHSVPALAGQSIEAPETFKPLPTKIESVYNPQVEQRAVERVAQANLMLNTVPRPRPDLPTIADPARTAPAQAAAPAEPPAAIPVVFIQERDLPAISTSAFVKRPPKGGGAQPPVTFNKDGSATVNVPGEAGSTGTSYNVSSAGTITENVNCPPHARCIQPKPLNPGDAGYKEAADKIIQVVRVESQREKNLLRKIAMIDLVMKLVQWAMPKPKLESEHALIDPSRTP